MDKLIMKKKYDQYYKCGNANCDSHYHVSMLDKQSLLCKDCNNESEVPKEANDKNKQKRK